MEKKNNGFTYTYSAVEQEEVRMIRDKYVPREESKLDRLRRLDESVTKKGTIISITLGDKYDIMAKMGQFPRRYRK